MLRYSLALLLCCAASAPALAEDLVLTCPVENLLLFRDSATKEMSVTVSGETMTFAAPFGDVTLPATVEERDGMIGVRAFGEATTPMPDKAAVDACLAQAKASQPADVFEDGRNEFLELGCKQNAAMTEPVPVTMSVELVVIEKPDAMLNITRRYADEEGAAAEIHGVDIIAGCKLTGS